MDNSQSKDETLWRTIDSDSDNPNDESNDKTIFFDLPDDDQIYFDARKSSFRGDKTIFETSLLDAMRDLQIKSAIKLKSEQDNSLSIDNKVSINLENVMNTEDAPNEQALEDVKSNPTIQENIQLEAKINSQTETALLEEKKAIVVEEVTHDEPEKNLNSQKTSANIIEAEKIILTGSEKNTIKEKIPLDENKVYQQEKTPKAIIKNDLKKLEKAIKTADKISSVKEKKINPKNFKQAESSLKKCDINLAQTKKILNDCPKVPLVFSSSMVKAMKPLLQKPSKKPSTIPITPKLMSSLRNRTAPKSISALTQPKNQLTNNNITTKSMVTSGSILKRQNSNISNTSDKSTASIKKNPQKLTTTVSTITTTKDGMKLKEEKINNFSIPVTVNRKKRTEFVPFNFSSREKTNKQQVIVNKKIDDKKIDNTKINVSKENKSNNIQSSKINLPKKKQERDDIDEKIKKRQLESKKVHDDVVDKKIALKKNEDIELRKKSMIKPTIMPNFKIPTGLRVSSTVSSCAIKNKRV